MYFAEEENNKWAALDPFEGRQWYGPMTTLVPFTIENVVVASNDFDVAKAAIEKKYGSGILEAKVSLTTHPGGYVASGEGRKAAVCWTIPWPENMDPDFFLESYRSISADLLQKSLPAAPSKLELAA